MSFRPRIAFIVSHTHWDREWYLPYQTFRAKLVGVVRQVLDLLEQDDGFHHFLMDGQSIILEDYLEIHPEDEARIRKCVEEGTLSVGPWYVLPDEFLISPESLVRNLVIGRKVAERFGRSQKAGYMPDSFGHTAQMPQILQQAKIDSFLFQRGTGDELAETGHEFLWEAPDGSRVLALNLCEGYCNAAALGHEELWHAHTRREIDPDMAVKKVGELFHKLEQHSNGDVVLLCNGCDHHPPQRELTTLLAALRTAFPETEFRHSDLESYANEVRKAGFAQKVFQGEFRNGKHSPILPGVWSSRMPLKQANERCQSLLSDQLEPLCAYSHFLMSRPYPRGLIETAWKLLIENHPHDSICGCSTDEVHREMVPRFEGVAQAAEEAIVGELENVAPTFSRTFEGDRHTLLCVANTIATPRDEIIERLVVLQPHCAPTSKLRLLSEDGEEIPFRILQEQHIERFWGVDYRTMLSTDYQLQKLNGYIEAFRERIVKQSIETDLTDRFLHIQFLARDLPALGHANFVLTDRLPDRQTDVKPGMDGTLEGVTVTENSLENRFCRAEIRENGSFDLYDKSRKHWYRGMNLLEDTEDAGDEYDYSPCENSQTVRAESAAGDLRVFREGGLLGAIEASFSFSLPRRLSQDRKSRSGQEVSCPVRVRVALRFDSPVVDIDLLFENRAEDHRLRALFPAGLSTQQLISDDHFYVHSRSTRLPKGKYWVQPPTNTFPQQGLSMLQADAGGFAVFSKGLPEIAAESEEEGMGMALTLLRCVGWLSRDDFETRRCTNAGPTIATPDAQCKGSHRCRYAVMPFSGDWSSAGVMQQSERWRTPPLVIQGVEDQSVAGGRGLLRKTSEKTSVTAVKKHEIRDTLIVRLFNLTGEEITETLITGRKVQAAWLVNLLEERNSPLVTNGCNVELRVKPFAVVGVELEFA